MFHEKAGDSSKGVIDGKDSFKDVLSIFGLRIEGIGVGDSNLGFVWRDKWIGGAPVFTLLPRTKKRVAINSSHEFGISRS